MNSKIGNFIFSLIFNLILIRLVRTTQPNYEYLDDVNNFKRNFRIELVETGPCTIPVVHGPISQEEFLQKYAYRSPVVIKPSQSERLKNELFQKKCQIDNLIEEFGDKFVTISTANTYSYNKYSMRLRDYLNKYVIGFDKGHLAESKLKYGNETWYFFGENNYTEWKPLLELYHRPRYELPQHEHAYSFGIAGFYSGVGCQGR